MAGGGAGVAQAAALTPGLGEATVRGSSGPGNCGKGARGRSGRRHGLGSRDTGVGSWGRVRDRRSGGSRGLRGCRRRSGSRALGGGRGSSARSTAPDLGTRDRVARKATVHVKQHTRSVGGDVARDGHTSRKISGTRPANLDMNTFLVELRTADPVSFVESNDLGADDVVARCNFGYSKLVLARFAGIGATDELCNGPGLAVPAVLCNLSPRLGGSCLCHVDADGSKVG